VPSTGRVFALISVLASHCPSLHIWSKRRQSAVITASKILCTPNMPKIIVARVHLPISSGESPMKIKDREQQTLKQ